MKLPLDDPRWLDLEARGAISYVLRKLNFLVDNPGDYDEFADLYPHLCSENTTWNSSFAAAPYIIEFSSHAPAKNQFEYALVIGLMEAYTGDDVPDFLQEGWKYSKEAAKQIFARSLWQPMDNMTTRYVLSAVAALKGYRELADVIESLDGCEECSQRLGYDV